MRYEQRTSLYRQSGLSLIELMIGVTVGLFILLGILQTLMVSKSASQSQQSMSVFAENARFAFEFMSRDLRMAGYKNDSGQPGIEFDTATGTLSARYKPDGANVVVSYLLDADAQVLRYSNTSLGVVNEILVDGVTGWAVHFGWFSEGDPDDDADDTVQYIAANDAGFSDGTYAASGIVSVRVTLILNNPVADGGGLALGDQISATIALRNPILAAKGF